VSRVSAAVRVVTVITVSLAVASCAKGTGGEQTRAHYDAGASLSGTLSVMGFGTDDDVAKNRLADAEQALGSDVRVTLSEGELDIQQFLGSVASGKPPSLIYISRDNIGSLASRGAIIPLTDCMKGEQIDPGLYRRSALQDVTFGGEIYGIPEFNIVQILMANSDLMEQAGVTLDDLNGSDWGATSKASRAMTVREGHKLQVIGYDTKLPEFLPLWTAALGGALISDDGRTATLDSPEVIKALTWATSVYNDEGGFGAVKAYRDSADFFGAENQFASATLGAMPFETWYVNVLNDVSPGVRMDFDVMRDRQGQPLAFATGQAWAIPAGSSNPEAACRMARVMTATSTWVDAAQKRIGDRSQGGIFTGLLTANQVADQKIAAMVPSSGSAVWDAAIKATRQANEASFEMPANPAGTEFETAWQDAVNRVLNGEETPEEAMDQAQKEAQAALDDAWKTWDDKTG
jgi:multiple sugar transport system substrate-binding protein